MLGRRLLFLVMILNKVFVMYLCIKCMYRCILTHFYFYLCYLFVIGPESDGGILPKSLNVIFNSIEGRIYSQNNIKPHRCVDFMRLTKEQQDEEATNKRNLLRRFKDVHFLYIYMNMVTFFFIYNIFNTEKHVTNIHIMAVS